MSRLLNIYKGMKKRCYNKNHIYYSNYGGRGIYVCDEWMKYSNFKKWAIINGYEDNLTIDRINNDGPYSPENCRWATMKEQARNRRTNKQITIGNSTKSMIEWSEIRNIDYQYLKRRINQYNWNPEEAVITKVPNDEKDPITIFSETKTIIDWSTDSRCVVSKHTLLTRLKAGWRPDIALTEKPRI